MKLNIEDFELYNEGWIFYIEYKDNSIDAFAVWDLPTLKSKIDYINNSENIKRIDVYDICYKCTVSEQGVERIY